ncbi:uncharacterized protein K452DRAFT_69247 [Aplosporella prunicola CBS 121167]|uniref:Uncharacterized protein n=1 Tax=Aplosporella prunicola CBS 121167 TaxID=1176127 RepID=A0A6A6BVG8_9PEZI|nr:uncharacterized protein K452DRAFT_69247 [Aplosporella prunicola CBS 121167]KAF2146681.1 hypothetical protein K452DRAFT_69247 [Aplosporella prunicola CBS 121167]
MGKKAWRPRGSAWAWCSAFSCLCLEQSVLRFLLYPFGLVLGGSAISWILYIFLVIYLRGGAFATAASLGLVEAEPSKLCLMTLFFRCLSVRPSVRPSVCLLYTVRCAVHPMSRTFFIFHLLLLYRSYIAPTVA